MNSIIGEIMNKGILYAQYVNWLRYNYKDKRRMNRLESLAYNEKHFSRYNIDNYFVQQATYNKKD